MDYFVVWALSMNEDAKFPLKNEEQFLDVAMLLAQNFNNHCALLERFCNYCASRAIGCCDGSTSQERRSFAGDGGR
jgi:hypothetical protein